MVRVIRAREPGKLAHGEVRRTDLVRDTRVELVIARVAADVEALVVAGVVAAAIEVAGEVAEDEVDSQGKVPEERGVRHQRLKRIPLKRRRLKQLLRLHKVLTTI